MFRWLLSAMALLGSQVALAQDSCVVTQYVFPDSTIGYVGTITMTGARDTTELTCPTSGPLLPKLGTFHQIEMALTAGTGTGMNPKFGRSAAWSTTGTAHVLSADSTAAFIHEEDRTSYHSSTGQLVFRPSPNSTATDHAISGFFIVYAGGK